MFGMDRKRTGMFHPKLRQGAGALCALAAMATLAGCTSLGSVNLPTAAGDSLLRAPPGDASTTLRMARATRHAGDLASAIQLYRTVAAQPTASPEVLVELGDVLLDARSPDDAIDVYSQVRDGSSARLGALLGTARAYLALAEPAKAADAAAAAQRLAPGDPRALVDRGVALDTLGRHDEAQRAYREALAVAPRHVPARNDLALSLALTGRFDEAVELMAPLVRSASATPQMRANMAVIYGLMGDSANAAALSRVDLDESATQANLQFLAGVRHQGS
jgi:Flp pilus assembly protein TadD